MEWFSFSHGQQHRPAPSFRLKSSRGEPVALADYRGRRNLVLLFLHRLDCPGCHAALQNLAKHRLEYQEHEAQVLVVVPTPMAELTVVETTEAHPFPLLADQEGVTRRAYAALLPGEPAEEAMLFVLDRYGAPYAALICPEPDDPALPREVLEWLAFIELQCPE